ncbi:MAG TPA: sigma-70 family RNA polymerase sigma factor [Opitutaceae bacterium]|nr:sigma-70 family RNA polymerase sigma factor [Opitutaceae bacterium]
MTPPERDRWFLEHVHVHRDVLRGWLESRFPRLPDLENIVQEAMTRVWHARQQREVPSPRALLFTTAHNLAVDQVRRQQIATIEPIAETDDLFVYEEGATPAEATAHIEELEILTHAIQSLPDRCRQVLTLRKIYGLSQKEIAAQLGISEHTVEVQVANGMRRCAQYFNRLGLT